MRELIIKYFNGNCTEEEKRSILAYFDEHPSELSSYFSPDDWEAITRQPMVPTAESEYFLQNIFKEKAKHPRYISYYKWAAAAVLLIIAGFSSFYIYNNYHRTNSNLASQNITQPASNSLVNLSNTSQKAMTVRLPDSTLVVLSTGSQLSYKQQFDVEKREVYLVGDATFKVHKDAARPFTVFCNELATTALGTKFHVSSKVPGRVSVLLLEGKILVKDKSLVVGEKYYLLPGNEIRFNRTNHLFTLLDKKNTERTDMDSMMYAQSEPSIDQSEVSNSSEMKQVTTSDNSIIFRDAHLPAVLNKLAAQYKVKISYPTEQAELIRFAGTVRMGDSIGKILSDLSIMNDFTLTFDSIHNTYILHR